MNHDPIAEMYALWERYNQVRAIGSKKMKKQAEQILNTLLECFIQQTPEVRVAFFEKIGMPAPVESDQNMVLWNSYGYFASYYRILRDFSPEEAKKLYQTDNTQNINDFYANAHDDEWFDGWVPQRTPTADDCQTQNTEGTGTRYHYNDGVKSGFIEVVHVENVPSEPSSESAQKIPYPLAFEHYNHFMLELLPEQIRRFKVDDAWATRWLGLAWLPLSQLKGFPHRKKICEELDFLWRERAPQFFYEKSYAIHKDPTTLRLIIREYMRYMNWHFYPRYNVPQCMPEFMNQTVAEARNYWEQLEPSTLKDKWNERFLIFEQIADCWDDYSKHRSLYNALYNDFWHYLSVNEAGC